MNNIAKALCLLLAGFFLTACRHGRIAGKPEMSDSTLAALDSILRDSIFYLTRGIGYSGHETPQYRCGKLLGRHGKMMTDLWA